MSRCNVSGLKLAPGECIPSKAQRIQKTNVLYQAVNLCMNAGLDALKHWHFEGYSGHLSSHRRSSSGEEKNESWKMED